MLSDGRQTDVFIGRFPSTVTLPNAIRIESKCKFLFCRAKNKFKVFLLKTRMGTRTFSDQTLLRRA